MGCCAVDDTWEGSEKLDSEESITVPSDYQVATGLLWRVRQDARGMIGGLTYFECGYCDGEPS